MLAGLHFTRIYPHQQLSCILLQLPDHIRHFLVGGHFQGLMIPKSETNYQNILTNSYFLKIIIANIFFIATKVLSKS